MTTKELGAVELDEVKQLPGVYGRSASHEESFFINNTEPSDFARVWRVLADGEIAWSVAHNQSQHTAGTAAEFGSDSVYWGLDYHLFESNDDATVTKITRRSLETGEKQWEFSGNPDDKNNVVASIVQVSSDIVAFGTSAVNVDSNDKPAVYGVDAETGDERWRATFSPGLLNKVLTYDGALYALLDDGIYRVDPDEETTTLLNQLVTTQNAAHDEGTVYCGIQDLRAVGLDGAEERWSVSPTGTISTITVDDDGGLFVGTQTGFVYRFDPSTGEPVWQSRINNAVKNFDFTPGLVWVPDGDFFKAFRREDGAKTFETEMWSKRLETVGNTLCHENGDDGFVLQRVRV